MSAPGSNPRSGAPSGDPKSPAHALGAELPSRQERRDANRNSRDTQAADAIGERLNGSEIRGSGSSSGAYFALEARNYHRPVTVRIGDDALTIGLDWTHVHGRVMPPGFPGIPLGYGQERPAGSGLFSYPVVKAHEACLIAALAASHQDLCTHTRIVRVKWQESYSFTEDGIIEEGAWSEDQRAAFNGDVKPRALRATGADQ